MGLEAECTTDRAELEIMAWLNTINIVLLMFGIAFVFTAWRTLPDGLYRDSARPRPITVTTNRVDVPAGQTPLGLQRAGQPAVAICAIATDDPDVVEWTQHYQDAGATKVFIYCHQATEQLSTDLQPFVATGFAALIDTTGLERVSTIQIDAYNHCLAQHKDFDFIGLFDIDEYIVIMNGTPLPKFMAQFQDQGGLVLNWRGFGSSGHDNRPSGSVQSSYTKCLPEAHNNNWHVKSIVNTRYVDRMRDPHSAVYLDDYFSVNTNFERRDGPFSKPALYDKAYLKHYGLRSREDYAVRLTRAGVGGSTKDWDYFERFDNESTADCSFLPS